MLLQEKIEHQLEKLTLSKSGTLCWKESPRSKFNIDDLIKEFTDDSDLLKQYAEEIGDKDKLREIYKEKLKSKKSSMPVYVKMQDHKLSEEEEEILRDFRWSSEGIGTILLYKIDKNSETYKAIPYRVGSGDVSCIISTLSIMKAGKNNCYERLKMRFENTVKCIGESGYLSGNVINGTKIVENEDKTKTAIAPQFLVWLSGVIDLLATAEKFKIKTPIPLTTNKKQPSYCYFDLSRLEEGPTPNFDLWSSIMTEDQKKIFLAWIFGIFDEQNNSRAALWLTDEGGTGKSRFLKALAKYIEGENNVGLVKSINKDINKGNQFAVSGIYGARLLVYGDCKNDRTIQSEVVHSILGNDLMSCEFKGQNSYHIRLNAKLLIASNVMPSINTQFNNELSRVIVLKLSKPSEDVLKSICLTDDDGKIEYYADGRPKVKGGRLDALLLPEMPHILYRAKKAYEELCPARSEYIIPDSVRAEMMSSLSSSEEINHLEFYDEFLEYSEGSFLESSKIQSLFSENISKDNRDFANFKRFLEQKNIHFKRTKTSRAFYNVTLKTPKSYRLEKTIKLETLHEDKKPIKRKARED